ncbi:hypothetical protein BJ742DRAFT_825350, partial [Cladochytrium replicatum]
MSASLNKKALGQFCLADAVTLCNAAAGSASIFGALKYVVTQNLWYLHALICDILDGRVARWSGTASFFGQELDSLADVISFGVAPAVLGFTVGLQGLVDLVILLILST